MPSSVDFASTVPVAFQATRHRFNVIVVIHKRVTVLYCAVNFQSDYTLIVVFKQAWSTKKTLT